jgi:N-acetylglucosaminyl-diphospho-decaprenol L-rhamnosyltransferase
MEKINPIIVNYRTPELTLKCVDSILRQGIANPKDIIVVENASPDDSFAVLKRSLPSGIQLVPASHNGGFSAGINTGASLATHEFILVLNPDTYFEDKSISLALDLFGSDSSIGMIGLDLTYPNGERQFSARCFYSVLDIVGRRSPLGRYWPVKQMVEKHMMLKAWEKGVPFDADWVMGTGFLIRRALFEKIGRMDEAYFLYMEDVDLCARVWDAGSRVVCAPGVRLIHDHQRSSSAGPLSRAGKMHLKSLSIFRKKYHIPFFYPPGVGRIFRH